MNRRAKVAGCFVALFGALAAAACGSAPVQTEDPASEAGARVIDATDDPVAGRMRELARRLSQAGLEIGAASGRGFLTSREQHTEALTLPAGTCATIVAMTSRGIRDLDATLFAPSGDVLAEDAEPDAHPTLQACAPDDEERRFYYSLTSYDGAGSYLFVSFVGPRASFAQAAEIIGGRPGVVSQESDPADLDAKMHQWSEGVARRGFRPLGVPVSVPLADEQRVRLPLPTELGQCYTVLVLGDAGLSNTDLRILSDTGDVLAWDDTPSQDAQAQICPDSAGDFSIEVHAKAGRGVARVAIFSGDQARVGGQSGLWLGERQAGRPEARALPEVSAALMAEALAEGWQRASVSEGALSGGGAIERRISLPRDRCSLIAVAGGRGVGALSLRVLDEEGRAIVEKGSEGAGVAARMCPERATDVSIQLVARRGQGLFVLGHFTKDVPTALAGDAAVYRGAVLDALEEASRTGWRLDERRTITEPATVPAVPDDASGERCVRVVAIAHRESGSVALSLLHDERLQSRDVARSASVESCSAPRSLRLTAVPLGQDGQAGVELMRFTR